MSDYLKELSVSRKKAVAALACQVVAQKKNGQFTVKDPEVDYIISECFLSDWIGNWDVDYRYHYVISAVLMDTEQCIAALVGMDQSIKFAFKNLLLGIIGDNASAMLAAGHILQNIKLEMPASPVLKKAISPEKGSRADDGIQVVEEAFFARLTDINAIRADNSDEVFTVKESAEDPGVKCGANYDSWRDNNVCPCVGVIGYVNPAKHITTAEGVIYYLICESNLIVPILEWGLEIIDQWEYHEKRKNNRILIYDGTGKRCEELMKIKKQRCPNISNRPQL